MSDSNGNGEKPERGSSSDVVTTRVNVAFPFSAIKVEAPTDEVIELAALVRDVVKVVAELSPGAQSDELVKRAETVVSRLK
jgi:hypothetical protein